MTPANEPQAAAPAVEAEHVCWLIETAFDCGLPSPLYFAGWSQKWDGRALNSKKVPTECFKKDANEAIRFPTKESTENMLAALLGCGPADSTVAIFRMHLGCYRVAEHSFDYTPALAATPAPTAQQEENR